MNLPDTLAVFAFGVGLMAVAVWRERRPRKKLDPPLIPIRPVLFIGTLIVVLSGIHLMTFLR